MAKSNSQPSKNIDLDEDFFIALDEYAKAIRRQVRPERKGLARLLLGP